MATQTHFSTPCMTTADASQVHDPHTLYSHHHGWLRAWLQRRLGCRDEAADLAQDTFLQVLLRPQALHGLRAYRTARQDLGGHGRAPRRPCHRLAPCARLRPDGRAPCHCGCARHAPVGPGLAGARKPHPVSLQVAPHAVRAAGFGAWTGACGSWARWPCCGRWTVSSRCGCRSRVGRRSASRWRLAGRAVERRSILICTARVGCGRGR